LHRFPLLSGIHANGVTEVHSFYQSGIAGRNQKIGRMGKRSGKLLSGKKFRGIKKFAEWRKNSTYSRKNEIQNPYGR